MSKIGEAYRELMLGRAFLQPTASFQIFKAGADYAKERDAKICDEYSADKWKLYKGRAPYTGHEDGRADPHVQGQSDGAEDCATLIGEQEGT